jgi:hypothetical protein
MTLRYRFIAEHRALYGMTRLCRVLAVGRPGFYAARTDRRGSASSCVDAAGGSTASGSNGSCASVAS